MSLGYFSKQSRAVGEVTVGIIEIGVVEEIENLPAELEVLAFSDRDFLVNSEVPLLEPRTAADTTLRSDIELTQLADPESR